MSLSAGARLGPYEVLTAIGAGGMGEVYRARDSRLGRDVAIKILPRVFTSDPERLARFEREARLLAALNHPHIGAIYGLEERDGVRALVLELVEGPTLAERLAQGSGLKAHGLPLEEALPIARQIAEALDAAHEKGIIHRDLKPANIKITTNDVVKVLDFGLAKAVIGDGAGPDLSQSPTATGEGTRDGVILGTAAYMSPEQARGKPVDKRTDIWAFGCVLYEMLTGHSTFTGETVSDTIAAILGREPDWNALPHGSMIAASPDGRHIAFVGRRGATAQLYLRTLQDAEPKALPETERATQPFFSPDSQWLAFFQGGRLKKVPTNGGVPAVICDAPSSRGGFWSENGTIVFAPQARGSGIFQVSADGGAAKAITTLDAGRGETSHRLPELLPGGETVLFVAYGATYQDVSVVAQSLKTGERRVLIDGASMPHYVATGHLLYVQPEQPGTIMAVAFDAERSALTGTPVRIAEGVLTDRGDYAVWSLARSGMLVYAPGGFQEEANDLVFVDRKGVAAAVGTPLQRPYSFPRLSPDGRLVVFSLQGIQSTLWIYEQSSGSFNRLTFEGNNDWPVWTPDGKRVTYASNRAEPWRLFWKPFDGSGKEEKVLATGRGNQQPYAWSSDGKVLVYQEETPATRNDIWALPIDGDRQPRPILQTPAAEVDAGLSPDSRWLVYASDESGRYEVYVHSFAGSGGKWQISTDGGREPVWAHNGREIFYRSGERMMLAEVATQPTFQVSTSRPLFQGPYAVTNTTARDYDVAADDQRFLMVQPSEQQSSTRDFNVVLNWTEELKRLVPTR